MTDAAIEQPTPRLPLGADRTTPSEVRYRASIRRSCDWLLRSERPGGGSAASRYAGLGWSRAYPETTGYIIPTLIEAGKLSGDERLSEAALRLGEWLLSIQSSEGWWAEGLHPPRGEPRASIFNTAQILQGMAALARHRNEDRWLGAAVRGAAWLASGVDAAGRWRKGHYRSGFQPAYYTRVAWPMLQVAELAQGQAETRAAAVRVLDHALAQRRENGSFAGWEFDPGKPAFTHTIAYTIEGLLGAAAMLEDGDRYRDATAAAVERLYRQAELNNGRLPGRFSANWRPDRSFVCVTGSAQTSICLLLFERSSPDLRLVNAAAKLADANCRIQAKPSHRLLGGDIPGSDPLLGPYMRGRYPNWASKFHIDALLMLLGRLDDEKRRRSWG